MAPSRSPSTAERLARRPCTTIATHHRRRRPLPIMSWLSRSGASVTYAGESVVNGQEYQYRKLGVRLLTGLLPSRFGKTVAASKPITSHFNYHDHRDHPLHTFVFKYRSKSLLQAMDIIEGVPACLLLGPVQRITDCTLRPLVRLLQSLPLPVLPHSQTRKPVLRIALVPPTWMMAGRARTTPTRTRRFKRSRSVAHLSLLGPSLRSVN